MAQTNSTPSPSPSRLAPPPPPLLPPLSMLEAMGGPAHDILASCLPDGDLGKETRFRLALVSRTMFDFHGATLTTLNQPQVCHGRVEALASFMQRQCGLENLRVSNKALPAAINILNQGFLRHVRKLELESLVVTLAHIQSLAEAIRVPGALQALESLSFYAEDWAPGMLQVLVGALASDAVPHLRVLDIVYGMFSEEDIEALAAMVETRAQLPACHRLERLDAEYAEYPNTSTEARCRLMRALLMHEPTEMDAKSILSTWAPEYEACFLAAQPLWLKKFDMIREEMGFSVQVLEAMPDLEYLGLVEGVSLPSVISALNRGIAFQRLHKLELVCLTSDDSEVSSLLRTLAGATCASLLTSLIIEAEWDVSLPTVAVLSELLGQDAFPMLQELWLRSFNALIILQGLLLASRTRLVKLDLHSGMGKMGLATLAKMVRAGHFHRLTEMNLSRISDGYSLDNDEDPTDEDVCMLARAIEGTGLREMPMLSTFNAWKLFPKLGRDMGLPALAFSLVKNCPRLTYLRLGESVNETVKGMMLVVGRRNRVLWEG